MDNIQKNSGSYRDPAGAVYSLPDGRIVRTVTEAGREDFEFVERTGIIDALCKGGKLVPYRLLDPSALPAPLNAAAYVLDHEVIPYISYPYEWSFGMLQAAALHHLDVHLYCLEHEVTLADASAYNIQFRGTLPCFIDRLSLIRYREGMPWAGHRQFCEQFLAPLLWWRHGIPFHAQYRGSMEGIPLSYLSRLVPLLTKCSLRYQLHVGLPLKFARVAIKTATPRVPRQSTRYLLKQLRTWITGLDPRMPPSPWESYSVHCHYDDQARQKKRETVASCIRAAAPSMLYDMGCNDGEYTRLAVENGAHYAVGFESDPAALEKIYRAAHAENLSILPLAMDIVSPSPDQGWRQTERGGFAGRATPDYLLALAIIHHMAIARGIPLADAVHWLTGLAPRGIIEWVDAKDPVVQSMLSTHTRRFEEYTEAHFTAALGERAEIIQRVELSEGRWLYEYRKIS